VVVMLLAPWSPKQSPEPKVAERWCKNGDFGMTSFIQSLKTLSQALTRISSAS